MEWLVIGLVALVIIGVSANTRAAHHQHTEGPQGPSDQSPLDDDDDPWTPQTLIEIDHGSHGLTSTDDLFLGSTDNDLFSQDRDPFTDPSQACLPGNIWHDSVCGHETDLGSQREGFTDDQ